MLGAREAVCQLKELHLVLAWVLVSLVSCDRVGLKKIPRLSSLPFSLLLDWVYTASKHYTGLAESEMEEVRMCVCRTQ